MTQIWIRAFRVKFERPHEVEIRVKTLDVVEPVDKSSDRHLGLLPRRVALGINELSSMRPRRSDGRPLTASWSAFGASSVSVVSLIAQPTTRREKRSSSTREICPPLAGRDVGDVAGPDLIRRLNVEVACDQVWGDRAGVVRIGCPSRAPLLTRD